MKFFLTNMAIRCEMGVEDNISGLFDINDFGPVNNEYMVPFHKDCPRTTSLLYFLNEMSQLKKSKTVLEIFGSLAEEDGFDATKYLIAKKVFCAYAWVDEQIIEEIEIGDSLEYSNYRIYRVSENFVVVDII